MCIRDSFQTFPVISRSPNPILVQFSTNMSYHPQFRLSPLVTPTFLLPLQPPGKGRLGVRSGFAYRALLPSRALSNVSGGEKEEERRTLVPNPLLGPSYCAVVAAITYFHNCHDLHTITIFIVVNS